MGHPKSWFTLRKIRTAAFILLLAFGVTELLLQGAALFVPDRSGAWRADARVKVLCIGDSHTFGAMVPLDESYPAHLQKVLDRLSPGEFSVLNLGIPGMSSTQTLHRLPRYALKYEPDIVMVWVGVNNMWNQAEMDQPNSSLSVKLDAWLYNLRVYRLVRVWNHDRSLIEATAAANMGVRGREELSGSEPTKFGGQRFNHDHGDDQVWTQGHGDDVEKIEFGKRADFSDDFAAARA